MAKQEKHINRGLQHDTVVPNEDIAQRAYALYIRRGCENGHDMEDWLQAEEELIKAKKVATERGANLDDEDDLT